MTIELDEIDNRTHRFPRVLWIELTSRCPFDCIFCTRKALRGAGEHMSFQMYERLIAELERPGSYVSTIPASQAAIPGWPTPLRWRHQPGPLWSW